MGNGFISGFTIITIILAVVDFYYGYKAFQKEEKYGRDLGLAAFAGGVVTIAYLCSIHADNYLSVSVASSIYFIVIDWMLVALIHFTYRFTDTDLKKSGGLIRKGICGYAIFDSLVLLINIFKEISVHYVPDRIPYAPYLYEMKPLYVMHLIFTYMLVALVLIILFDKSKKTPRQYRNQYTINIVAILGVVAINAVFLYIKGDSIFYLLDYSIIGYSVALVSMYWAAFEYRTNDMLKSLSMTIFENIDQGIVLFDYNDKLIMRNERADRLLSGVSITGDMQRQVFMEKCSIAEEACRDDHRSMECEIRGNQGNPLRCDFTRLRDPGGGITGSLFVFTDASNEIDLLTGFLHRDDFRRFAGENPFIFDHPTTTVVFDIIGLGEINRTFGREVGDQRIRNLAKSIRSCMPENSYFIRGNEARLRVVCCQYTEEDLRGSVERVIDANAGTVMFGISSTADGTENDARYLDIPESRNIIDAMEASLRGLQVKKLLSPRSERSQTLSSLVRALQESDTDTEAHVQRTQKMGAELGKRIGLNDAEMADLKLLCLLHDIGKIGIPLEILNKPGRLTDEEWAVLRTHSEKGYQIAMSSYELREIARMVLYHHERWDGKGYPERLAGNSIPLLSRVIAIVDAYDAMVNDRAYRKGMEPEKAQEEIRRCAGSQFDPDLAKEFLDMLEENPGIAAGEKTGGEDVRLFMRNAVEAAESGNTVPVLYSRYILNLDDIIIDTDSRFEEMTGYKAQEAEGHLSQYDLIPPEDHAFYMVQVNEQFSKGDIAYLRHEILRKDGSRAWVMCYGKRFYSAATKDFRSEILISLIE